jgi:solute carrier family 25 phosphate transporter 23/24/25/41
MTTESPPFKHSVSMALTLRESPQDRKERIRRLFDRIDKNGDGLIEPNEISETLCEFQRGRPARERPIASLQMYARELVQLADSTNQLKITWPDFLKYVQEKETELFRLFKTMDTNNDGILQVEEIQAALDSAGIKTNSGDLVRFLRILDHDRNRNIDFDEFRSFFLWLPGKVNFATLYQQQLLLDSSYDNQSLVPLPRKNQGLDMDQRLKYLLCGALAGGVSRTMTAPLDRMRVYFINRTSNSLGTNTKIAWSTELLSAVRAIYKNGGLPSFWRGNLLELIKMVPGSAIMFTCFEQGKSIISKMEGKTDRNSISPQGRFLAGGFAGMISMTAGFPLSTIKTRVMSTIAMESLPSSQELIQAQAKLRMQATIPSITNVAHPLNAATQAAALAIPVEHEVSMRHPILRTAVNIYRDHGIRGYFFGLGPAILGVFPYSAINLSAFDLMKKEYIKRNHKDPSSLLTMVGGSLSGAIGSVLVYPIQLTRTRLQSQGTISHPYTYKNAWDCVKRTVSREGVRGLYKGILPSLAKVLPAASITRLVFEKSKNVLHLE